MKRMERPTLPSSSPPVPAKAPIPIIRGMSAAACLCLHLACGPSAWAQDRGRLEEAARWAVRSAIPDGVDDWPVFSELRLRRHAEPGGRAVVVACGTLEFADPLAGRTRFVVLLAPDAPDWREALRPAQFYGSDRAPDSLPIAALCDDSGPRQASDADLHAAMSRPP